MVEIPVPNTPPITPPIVTIPIPPSPSTLAVPAIPPPPQPASNLQYFVTVIIMAIGAVTGVVLVSIFHPGDNIGTIAAIFGFAVSITASILSFQKAQETHVTVNSQLSAMMKNAQIAGVAQGLITGTAVGEAKANERTDRLAANANTNATTPSS